LEKYDPKYNFEQVVLYVGRVAKEKDLDVFIEVYELMKNNPKVKFAIVGYDPYLKELKQTYEGKIIFTGFLEGEELSKAFASADFFLFPSTTETFGNVVLEAMASGLIPLVSDKGTSKENIVEDIIGFVISNNDPKEYKLIFKRLIENPVLSQKIRNNILKLVSNLDERNLLLEMIENLA
jgi:glycosyltransferase involved in cell wall biosynthesis